MNKVLKMDFRGQTAVLSAFVLVGMMFLVPVITEKALAQNTGAATGTCGPEGQTDRCEFVFVSKSLSGGEWIEEPGQHGNHMFAVTWEMAPAGTNAHIRVYSMKGSVTYDVGLPFKQKQRAVLSFDLPAIGSNTCSISGIGGSCTAGKGWNGDFTYNLRSTPNFETCRELKATIAEDELANSAQWKNMQCESLLK